MPTILFINGWRFFFYANENNEPVHIHVRKAEMEAQFWLKENLFEVEESFSYNMDSGVKKEVRKIIFEHFDYIIEQWDKFRNQD